MGWTSEESSRLEKQIYKFMGMIIKVMGMV